MTTELAGDALAKACAEAMYARDHHARAMGMTVEEIREGYARVAMTITGEMINGHRTAHGGTIFSLADTAFAYSCNTRDVPNVALQCSISFVAPAVLGDRVVAEGVERAGGKGRTGLYDITVTREDGTPLAFFRGVCYKVRGTVLEGREDVGSRPLPTGTS